MKDTTEQIMNLLDEEIEKLDKVIATVPEGPGMWEAAAAREALNAFREKAIAIIEE